MTDPKTWYGEVEPTMTLDAAVEFVLWVSNGTHDPRRELHNFRWIDAWWGRRHVRWDRGADDVFRLTFDRIEPSGPRFVGPFMQ